MTTDFQADMLAQVESASDDNTLFEMAAYCNRYVRQTPTGYVGPKMRDGGRVPQAVFTALAAAVAARRQVLGFGH